MKSKIFLIAAALLLLVLQNAGASPPESDTVWTRTLPFSIKGCAFSLTGDSIISIAGESGGDSLFILETATGHTLKSIKCKGWVRSYGGFVHFNTKSWIAIAVDSTFGGLYIYDYLKDSIVNEKFGFDGKAIAITKDDKYIYVQNNSVSYNNISIYDVERGYSVDSISSYGRAHSLAISPDNKYLAIGTGAKQRVRPYPEHSEYEEDRMYDKLMIFDIEKKELVKEFGAPFGTEGEIREIKFSPDGKYLGVAKLDGNVYVYQMDNIELYRTFKVCDYYPDSGPWVMSFSNNSSLLYCGIFLWNKWRTEIFDIKNNILLKSLNIYSYSGLLVDKNDYLLMAASPYITFLKSNWLTGIKELIDTKKEPNNITINKSNNSVFKFSNIINVNNIKLYNYKSELINTTNIINYENNNLTFNAENLLLGVYILVINNEKTIKILVAE